jgi:cell division inhibitor SulA
MQFPTHRNNSTTAAVRGLYGPALAPNPQETVDSPWSAEPEVFSELSLRGAAGNCLNLLAPILRELSEEQDARWLTLIAPPASLTQAWLRDAGPEPRAHPAAATTRRPKRPAADLRSIAPGP